MHFNPNSNYIFFLVIRLHLYSFQQKRDKISDLISIVFFLFYILCNLYTKLRQNIYKKNKILNMELEVYVFFKSRMHFDNRCKF